jgi:tetratricopeptide (TPR) repeat protein
MLAALGWYGLDRSPAASTLTEVRVRNVETLAYAHLKLRPADFMIPLSAARILTKKSSPEALRWINHAMYLNPHHHLPHYLAAKYLLAAGRLQQARSEATLALRLEGPPHSNATTLLLRSFSVQDILAASKDVPEAVGYIGKALRASGRNREALQILAAGLNSTDNRVFHVSILEELTYSALANSSYDEAVGAAKKLVQVEPTLRSKLLLIQSLTRAGSYAEAQENLRQLSVDTNEYVPMALRIAAGLIRDGGFATAETLLKSVISYAHTREHLAEAHNLMAIIETARNNIHRAEWEAREAVRIRSTMGHK